MASIPFEVDSVFTITGRGAFVMVRSLDPDFRANLQNATLGGCAIEPFWEIPRKLDANGNARVDVFIFLLRNADDRARFEPGQRVDLVTP